MGESPWYSAAELGRFNAQARFVRCSGIGTRMTFLSADQDFERSLQALRGCLARLAYIADLRTPEGGYAHWGLARTHTPEQAEAAIRAAHLQVLGQVLKMPLRTLVIEIEATRGAKESILN